MAVGLLVNDLDVGERGLAARAPVNQPLGAVEQPVFPQANERLAHRAREPFVHRETLVTPIARDAERLQLVENRAACLFLPLPDALDEFRTPELRAILPFFGELALDDVL